MQQVKAPRSKWQVEARSKEGELLWVEDFSNLVFDAGINHMLSTYFAGTSYTAAWYVGLLNGTPTLDAEDTMASHAGWTENTDYDEAARQTLVLGAVSSKSVNNSADRAVFTMSDAATIAGVFLTTSASKGLSSGTLYCAALFAEGSRVLAAGATLGVTCTLSGA